MPRQLIWLDAFFYPKQLSQEAVVQLRVKGLDQAASSTSLVMGFELINDLPNSSSKPQPTEKPLPR